MAEFSIPTVDPERWETVYANLAKRVYRDAPSLAERIDSIVFNHDGCTWTATVGESLRGEWATTHHRKGRRVEIPHQRTDPATVCAIFPGDPYIVWTDATPDSGFVSHFENPFYAGRPRAVHRFDVTEND